MGKLQLQSLLELNILKPCVFNNSLSSNVSFFFFSGKKYFICLAFYPKFYLAKDLPQVKKQCKCKYFLAYDRDDYISSFNTSISCHLVARRQLALILPS